MFGHEQEDEENEQTTLEVIKNLMEQLVGEMEPKAEDFEERLGRKKPEVIAMKVEGKLPGHAMEEESMEEEMMPMEEGPEDSLKKRLMKLRA